MTRDQVFIAHCDRINRTRPLTEAEVDRLVVAIERDRQRVRRGCHGHAWTIDEVAEVEKAVRNGLSFEAAGELVGRSKAAVSYAIRQYSSLPRRPNGRPKGLPA